MQSHNISTPHLAALSTGCKPMQLIRVQCYHLIRAHSISHVSWEHSYTSNKLRFAHRFHSTECNIGKGKKIYEKKNNINEIVNLAGFDCCVCNAHSAVYISYTSHTSQQTPKRWFDTLNLVCFMQIAIVAKTNYQTLFNIHQWHFRIYSLPNGICLNKSFW